MEPFELSKHEEIIINCGAFSYDARRIANVIDIEEEQVKLLLADKSSQFYKLYHKGKDKSDYAIDVKLFELAQSGDIKALDKLNERITKRRKEA